MADLQTVRTFFDNPDAYSAFLHRVEAALVEEALNVRAEEEPSPMNELFRARQLLAINALNQPARWARVFLPALAVKANDAGLLSEQGNITATDAQIRATVAGLFSPYCDYVPASA